MANEQQYRARPLVVRVQQFTATDTPEGVVIRAGLPYLETTNALYQIKRLDYIVTDAMGVKTAMSPARFHALYESVMPEFKLRDPMTGYEGILSNGQIETRPEAE